MCFKQKLKSKEMYNKLWEYKKIRDKKHINSDEYILTCLKIIENELNKGTPIKDEKYILGARQLFVLEEFEKYIKEQNYEGAYYDLEDFIGFQRIPTDLMKGLKEAVYISKIEADKIQYMISVLKSKLKVL